MVELGRHHREYDAWARYELWAAGSGKGREDILGRGSS